MKRWTEPSLPHSIDDIYRTSNSQIILKKSSLLKYHHRIINDQALKISFNRYKEAQKCQTPIEKDIFQIKTISLNHQSILPEPIDYQHLVTVRRPRLKEYSSVPQIKLPSVPKKKLPKRINQSEHMPKKKSIMINTELTGWPLREEMNDQWI
ncbi:hypothetical protein pb186bvf_016859 [Paramecium bursaria]